MNNKQFLLRDIQQIQFKFQMPDRLIIFLLLKEEEKEKKKMW